MGDSGAQALAGLKNAAALHTLTLNLWHNNVGDSGAEALAGLKNVAALHTLTLNLAHNDVGDSGVQALVGLKNAAALHTARAGGRAGTTMWVTVVRKPLQG